MKKLCMVLLLLASVEAVSQELEPSQIVRGENKNSLHTSFNAGIFHGHTYRGLSLGQSKSGSDSVLSLNIGDSANNVLDGLTTTVGISLRQFLGNSFNIKADLSYRMFKGRDYWFRLSDFQKTNQYVYRYDDIIFDFSIGNHWYFDSGLFIGTDWIGLGGQVVKVSSSTDFEIGEANSKTENQIKNIERSRQRLQLSLLNFSIGYMF